MQNINQTGPMVLEKKSFEWFLPYMGMTASRGSPKKHFCEISLKSEHWSRRRCEKISLFLALAASLFSGLEPF